MLIEAGYGRWKRAMHTVRPWSCLWMLVNRADTAPIEFCFAVFTTIYAARMLIGGVGVWAEAEYMCMTWMGVPYKVWPWSMFLVGVAQLCSVFSFYPMTKFSRALRIVATALSAVIWTFDTVIHFVLIPHEPEWIAYSGYALGAMWVLLRTRSINNV